MIKKPQKYEHPGSFLPDKKTGLTYSLYLAIGSVSLFSSLVALNNAYQGVIWSYSTRYIMNSMILAFALFLAGTLLIIACFKLTQGRQSARLFALFGIAFLIIYSLFVVVIDRYISYTVIYILMLLILFALILLGVVIFFRKKNPF